MSTVLKLLVLGVAAVAVPAVASTTTIAAPARGDAVALLALLAGIAGAYSIRLPGRHCELTATHPLILCALAGLGPVPAVLTAVAGVCGTLIAHRGKSQPHRAVYNIAAVALAAAVAAWTFHLLGGRAGDSLRDAVGPLAAATAAYLVANTGLVALAIAIETRQTVLRSWYASLAWTVPSYFTGLTIAALLLLVLESLGPRGLILALPPAWLLVAFYRVQRERIEEQDRRLHDVEALNGELGRTVDELRHAAAHVKRLQGLLPICMHCKAIRDDSDAWHQIDAYLAEHAEVRFTHSVCHHCREKHYPAPAPSRV